jgi:hypothetical protein
MITSTSKPIPPCSAALVAGAEQKLGQGVESVGEAGLSYLQARQEVNNEVHASERQVYFAGQQTPKLEKFRQLEGNAAALALDQYNKDLQDSYKQMLEGENPRVQAMLARGLAPLVDRYQSYAAIHAATQERTWHDKVAADGAKTMGDVAMLDAQTAASLPGPDGWHKLDQSLAASDAHVENYWNQKNSSADPEGRAAVDHEVARNRGANVLRIVKDLAARGQVDNAEVVLDHNKSKMDAGSISAADTALKTLRNEKLGYQGAAEETGKALRSETVDFLKGRSGARVKACDRSSPTG